ncbi:SH2 domain-containing adapter protein D isoform X1 [Cuculus canorus]|uniref:SH2 domain-containing adapter protein D isoform X1 n=1 Tax=Cuculus canorus TaxID=55661 RepID=UPI0023AAD147|nr:SH2 domain-containing adapter protein D isoform X1 [Cuculus canorus]
MAKWLREYLGRGARRSPPRPPQPDYSERRPAGTGAPPALRGPAASPRHRLVRVGGGRRGEQDTHLQGPSESEYSEPFEGEQEPAPEGGCEEPSEATAPRISQPCVSPGCPRHGEGRQARPRRGPQLYDTPYEDWDTAGEDPGVPTTRESRLPRDDERPADEYDQPWEWKKDHISRAFAVQFESPERSPSLSRQLPRTPRPSAGTRAGCPPSPRHVDTSLPLEKQAWYHGPIGRAGAETLLALCREGSFLVRDCETSPDDYSLSLRSSHGFVHVKLTRTREQHFVLGRAGAAFPSVPEAVRHYTARALPVRGARHLSLLYPVAVQPL